MSTYIRLGTRFVRLVPVSRLYSQVPKETVTVVEKHWALKFFPSFLIKKKGFVSNCSTSESGQINQHNSSDDFQEKINYDYNVPLSEFERVSKENGELKADLGALKKAYMPLCAAVKCRQAIENWENVFGVQYPYDNRKPDKKSSVLKAYNFHYDKWVWIWNNCQDARWLEIKKEIQSNSITEVEACSSISSMLSLAGHDLHFPPVIGEITSEDVIKTLKTPIGIDDLSLSCVRPILRVHESYRKS